MMNFLSLMTGYDTTKHKELLRNAEAEQLVREALAAREPNDPFYYGALAAFGRRLSGWGEELQERYGEVCDSIQAADLPLKAMSREQV